jgi:hypothetical protein
MAKDPLLVSIESLVEKDQLRDYAAGFGEFTPAGPYPELDYMRWNRIEEYYRSLSLDSPERGKIDDVLKAMFVDGNRAEMHAALVLARLLETRAIAAAMDDSIRSDGFPMLPMETKRDILETAARLQLSRCATLVVENAVKFRMVDYLLIWWSKNPGAPLVVDEGDVWRARSLAQFFEGCSDECRKSITEQLSALLGRAEKARRIVAVVLEQGEDGFPAFREAIAPLLGPG